MNVTKERVKSELGILDNRDDAKITANIPLAEAKYRAIANYGFNSQFYADINTGDTTLELSTHEDSPLYRLTYGDIIGGGGAPDETFITDINKRDGIVTLSEAFTEDADYFILGQNVQYYPVISSLIWYMIGQQSTTAQGGKGVISRTVGPLSVTFDKSAINTRYGIPDSIAMNIPKYESVY